MNLKKKFGDQDLIRIKAAVKEAENKISGEIVPFIVERSGQYSIANYKACVLGAALTFIAVIIFDRYIDQSTSIQSASYTLLYDPLFIFLLVILGGVLGAVIPHFSDAVKRLLVSKHAKDLTTRQAAENAFLEEEVFNTRQRTGIMIFISFFEHEVIVMADQGINKVVDQNQWDKIVSDIIKSIRNGRIVEGLEEGIKQCGQILLEKGFYKTEDDVNELRDDLRV